MTTKNDNDDDDDDEAETKNDDEDDKWRRLWTSTKNDDEEWRRRWRMTTKLRRRMTTKTTNDDDDERRRQRRRMTKTKNLLHLINEDNRFHLIMPNCPEKKENKMFQNLSIREWKLRRAHPLFSFYFFSFSVFFFLFISFSLLLRFLFFLLFLFCPIFLYVTTNKVIKIKWYKKIWYSIARWWCSNAYYALFDSYLSAVSVIPIFGQQTRRRCVL